MAKFTVAVSNGTIATYEGEFDITKGGLLVVTPTEGPSSQLIYAPGAWLCLDVKK